MKRAYSLKAGHSKAIFTVRDVVDSDGDIVASYEFSEYGQRISSSESGASSEKTFVGGLSVQDEVADTGLMLMGHRFYEPEVGRFLNRDPIGFRGGLNLFEYGRSSPISHVDPRGLQVGTEALALERARAIVAAAMAQGIIVGAATPSLPPGKILAGGLTAIIVGISLSIGGDDAHQSGYTKGHAGPFEHMMDADAERVRAEAVQRMRDMAGDNRTQLGLAGLGIVQETRCILNSPQLTSLHQAYSSGISKTVTVNERLIQFEPGLPFSGMTMFGENGFILSDSAFSSNEELTKTILHELYRLTMSQSSGGISGNLASQETGDAFYFAEIAYKEYFK